jgi:hypothetical protein
MQGYLGTLGHGSFEDREELAPIPGLEGFEIRDFSAGWCVCACARGVCVSDCRACAFMHQHPRAHTRRPEAPPPPLVRGGAGRIRQW